MAINSDSTLTAIRIDEMRYGFATPRVRWEIRDANGRIRGVGPTRTLAWEDVALRDAERRA